MPRLGFTRPELALVGTGALLVFSRVFGLSLVMPNFRDHFGDSLGVNALWIGLAFSAHGLTMALMQLPLGALSDRWGRRPVLLIASALFVGGSVLAAFADSYAFLLAGRLMQGLGAISSVAMAAVGEALPPQRRTTGMAMVGIPAGAGFLLGIAAGPVLYPIVSMRGLFLIVAGMGLAAALPLPKLRFAEAHERPQVVTRMAAPVAALALGGLATNYFLTTTLFFLPTTDWRILTPMLVVAFVVVGGLSRRIDKAGWTWQPLAVGWTIMAVAAPAFALGGGGWAWFAGGVFFATHATLATALPSQVSRIAGPSGGKGHGVQNVVAYSGTFVAGPVAGALAAQAGWAFAVAGGLGLAAAALVALRLSAPSPAAHLSQQVP